MTASPTSPLLVVTDLQLQISKRDRVLNALNGVSFQIAVGQSFGLVGETGAGKSLTSWSIMRLVEEPLRIVAGSIQLDGRELLALSEGELRKVRGKTLSLIVQNPRGSLDPLTPVGAQIVNAYRAHAKVSKAQAAARALEMLTAVGIADPPQVARTFPHELSGGMAQRVLIAMAMINEPRLLIADEPTTGLDVTVQAQILDLIRNQVVRMGSSVLLITHDLGIIAHYCDRVGVMFAGRIIEEGPVKEIFANPQHPYTRALLAAAPSRPATRDSGLSDAGAPPDLSRLGEGCHYLYRCPYAAEVCRLPVPLRTVADEHVALCHFPESLQKDVPGALGDPGRSLVSP